MAEITFEERLKSALKDHALDVEGNVYTIGLDDVLAYFDELKAERPELFQKAQVCDPVQLALEIADMIGNEGIVEHVENAIREAIRSVHEVYESKS